MEFVIIAYVLITLGLLFSFLNGVIFKAEFEDLQNTGKNIPGKIILLFDKKEVVEASFLFFELLFYLISLHLLTVELLSHFGRVNPYTYILFTLLAFSVFSLRSVLYVVATRFSKKLILMTYKIIYYVFLFLRFSGEFYYWIQRKVSPEEEEATLEVIQEVVETAHDEGTLQTGEYKILTNVIKFNQVPVSDVMTPRTVIFACNADMTVDEAIKLPEIKIYSRFPIYEGNSLDDKVIGYVVSKDVFQAALNKKLDTKLREFARDILFIPENITLDDALNQFLSKRQHIFLVVDEFGGIEGLLTMEDLIETILGEEIIDEADKYIDLRELAKRKRENRLKLTKEQQQYNQQANQ
jgi:CBS domain containing-hemolysin-like protein